MKKLDFTSCGADAITSSRPAALPTHKIIGEQVCREPNLLTETVRAAQAEAVPGTFQLPATWQENPGIEQPGGQGAGNVVTPHEAAVSHKVRQPRKPGAWDGRKMSQRYVADYKPFVMVDGEGVRCSIYVSGCPFHCPSCYNVASQNFRYGEPYTPELEDRIMEDCAKSYVDGLSLVGGEPFLNSPVLLPLVQHFRKEFGNTKTIWSWTGYTWEQLQVETPDKQMLLAQLDVLVDGPFIQEQFYHNLSFRGSRNQRIIDVPASFHAGEVRLWKNGDYA